MIETNNLNRVWRSARGADCDWAGFQVFRKNVAVRNDRADYAEHAVNTLVLTALLEQFTENRATITPTIPGTKKPVITTIPKR
ncbi:hypothetical protein [Rhodococcus wratislaviensis]|uniref:Uncharacterized protein n=1 Tax=Rhodococcus wratislaviensis NBRC 100605 TaxID=1219028 RepID=X0QGS2_RHOWR|nr:hypothetical protein [Rhodococcus wratislaviensis]GAF50767.1 hypothetical protein RW1_095_03920 [Rhodococcus wratislaviensis NBRC 100605]